MTEEIDLTLDINTASPDELSQLPGVGAALAERIVAMRPFVDLDDLRRVSGVGAALIEKLAPHVADSFAVEEAEAFVEVDLISEAEEAPISPGEENKVPPAPREKPAGVTRTQVLMIALGSSFVAFILALIFTFSILAGLNSGSLRFASPGEINRLNNQLDGLSAQITTLEDDLDGLRTRLDNLETLGSRITAAEDTLETLSAELETVQTQNDNVQTVMESLRDLLLELFPPAEVIE